ncbi:hypothetical protein BAE44_0000495 [Dichanthelium oligosanthes]|uniref:Uncharacterized protein n=1 Tax=Dichanthelium oligosanthes TaxID=888268 RepID=A0A1E5WM41_9POAL|nr:hypothetical protein BAE44_0000495 [Dichanthelium oligosanthes]
MDLVRREADRGAAPEFVALDIRGEAESPGSNPNLHTEVQHFFLRYRIYFWWHILFIYRSSVGTLILLYFTLSMGKMTGGQTDGQ